MTRRTALLALLFLAGCGQRGFPPPDRAGPPPGPMQPRETLFISPSGKPFRGKSDDAYPVGQWFAAADADRDGRLTRDEFRRDADAFFVVLDGDHDDELDPDEVRHYEQVIAPEIVSRAGMGRAQGGPGAGFGGPGGRPDGRGGRAGPGGGRYDGPSGGAMFELLGIPHPVVAADADINRSVTRAEFATAADRRFRLLDKDADGVLTLVELPETRMQSRLREAAREEKPGGSRR